MPGERRTIPENPVQHRVHQLAKETVIPSYSVQDEERRGVDDRGEGTEEQTVLERRVKVDAGR